MRPVVIEPHQVGIIYNVRSQQAKELAEAIRKRLGMGASAWVRSTKQVEQASDRLDGLGVVITVGGDGTILRTVRLAAPAGVPLLGVNMGRLGFMTELRGSEALDRIPWYLEGNAWVDERAMLQAQMVRRGTAGASGAGESFRALNDVVVGRGAVSRLVQVRACVDGAELTTFRADAVIVATATGSTGYAMSAGGPVLYPRSRDILLKAVAPHISLSTAVVLWPEATVELTNLTDRDAMLSVDGYLDHPVRQGDVVRVTLSSVTARFLRARPAVSFFETLTQRLGLEQPRESPRPVE